MGICYLFRCLVCPRIRRSWLISMVAHCVSKICFAWHSSFTFSHLILHYRLRFEVTVLIFILKHFILAGTVHAVSFNGSFNGDGTNLNLASNSIIQTILSNITALSKLYSSVAAAFAPTSAAPSAAPTSPSAAPTSPSAAPTSPSAAPTSPSSGYPVGI